METSKIKNVFILALVLVNIFLLILVLPQELESKNTEKESREYITELFAQRGIDINWDGVSKGKSIYTLLLDGDSQGQNTVVEALLGNTSVTESDSLVGSSYEGINGIAEFLKSGEFSVELLASSDAGGDIMSHGKGMLKKMGLQICSEPELVRISAGKYQLTATQKVEGVPVYSSKAVLEYSNSCLKTVSGVWYFTYSGNKGTECCIDLYTALVSFLSSQNQLGWLCTSIQAASQGYIEEETPALGAASLTPVWRIETDTDIFYVNGLTKEVTYEA